MRQEMCKILDIILKDPPDAGMYVNMVNRFNIVT